MSTGSEDPEEGRSESRDDGGGAGLVAQAGRYTGLGLTLALATFFFLLVGWWLDGHLGTFPLFLILGAFVGGAAGFYSLYHHVVSEARKQEDRGDR